MRSDATPVRRPTIRRPCAGCSSARRGFATCRSVANPPRSCWSCSSPSDSWDRAHGALATSWEEATRLGRCWRAPTRSGPSARCRGCSARWTVEPARQSCRASRWPRRTQALLSTLTDAIAWRDPAVRPLFERALKDPSEQARFRSLVAQWERERRGCSAEYRARGDRPRAGACHLRHVGERVLRQGWRERSRQARGGHRPVHDAPRAADRLAKALGLPLIGKDEYTAAYDDLVRGVEDLVWQVTPGWSRRGIPQRFEELDQLL